MSLARRCARSACSDLSSLCMSMSNKGRALVGEYGTYDRQAPPWMKISRGGGAVESEEGNSGT